MHIQSSRQVGQLWIGALLIFVVSAWISNRLLPTAGGTIPTSPPASYYIGLVGLLAIGIALVLTWSWVRRSGPVSRSTRALLQGLLAVGAVLWLAAMVFPFM